MKRLKAAFFDLDDTLCDDALVWESCAAKAASLAVGIDSATLAGEFLKVSEAYWMSLEPVTETRSLDVIRETQWFQALRNAGADADYDLAVKLARSYGTCRSTEIALFPDALTTLAHLHRHGVTLALITNGVQLTHVEKIEYLGLQREFDHLLIADAVGSFKPDPAIYLEALRRCGCEADEAIMVGDHLDNDIRGAQAVGLTAYWFNPHGRERPIAKSVPDGEIRSLTELIGLIESRWS